MEEYGQNKVCTAYPVWILCSVSARGEKSLWEKHTGFCWLFLLTHRRTSPEWGCCECSCHMQRYKSDLAISLICWRKNGQNPAVFQASLCWHYISSMTHMPTLSHGNSSGAGGATASRWRLGFWLFVPHGGIFSYFMPVHSAHVTGEQY